MPCIGALIAARSAPWRRPTWLGADVGQPEAAAEHGLDVAVALGLAARLFHVAGDAGIAGEVALDVGLRGAAFEVELAARPKALMP